MAADHRFQPRVHVQVREDAADVIAHRVRRDPERVRDRLRRVTGGEVVQDVQLPRRQVDGFGLRSRRDLCRVGEPKTPTTVPWSRS